MELKTQKEAYAHAAPEREVMAGFFGHGDDELAALRRDGVGVVPERSSVISYKG